MARIERLAAENQRTQGAERRAWYRRHSVAHLQAVAALLDQTLAAYHLGAPKQAVVLGAGACTELPLERLARFCDSVLLVDVDVPGLLRARDELPSTLRERVNVLGADITGGVSATLANELHHQPWADLASLAGPDGNAPLDAAAGCLERCAVPNPPRIPELAPGGYGIVISSLVLTQLFSLPLLDLLDTLVYHAAGVADMREAHPRYHTAALAFRRRVALAHLALLDLLLAPQGVGYFASDVTGYLLPPKSGPHAQAERESLPVLPPDVLAIPADFATRFTVHGAVRRWQWLVSSPDATHPGRSYDVCGLVFGKR